MRQTQAERSRADRQRTIRRRTELERTLELCHTFARLSKPKSDCSRAADRDGLEWLHRESEWLDRPENDQDLLDQLSLDNLRQHSVPVQTQSRRIPRETTRHRAAAPCPLADIEREAQCPACGRRFRHAESLEIHLRGCDATVTDSMVATMRKTLFKPQPSPPERPLCPVCGIGQDPSTLRSHADRCAAEVNKRVDLAFEVTEARGEDPRHWQRRPTKRGVPPAEQLRMPAQVRAWNQEARRRLEMLRPQCIACYRVFDDAGARDHHQAGCSAVGRTQPLEDYGSPWAKPAAPPKLELPSNGQGQESPKHSDLSSWPLWTVGHRSQHSRNS
eukprot:TRINITY_DN14310_c0_g1_i1.p1 TRINITY_DN14310_c0_g1~~TRINITY_DN14310_c0_g1_i1.p1  ORF type:complete len:331 (+),score=24.73 TRINITY_DN14310_c0_g1_i1:90-1082(+)